MCGKGSSDPKLPEPCPPFFRTLSVFRRRHGLARVVKDALCGLILVFILFNKSVLARRSKFTYSWEHYKFREEGSYVIVSVSACLGMVHFLLCVVYCRLFSLEIADAVSVKVSVTPPTMEDLVWGIVS